MERTFCDRCGKEMEGGSGAANIVEGYSIVLTVLLAEGDPTVPDPDVCRKCALELLGKLPA